MFYKTIALAFCLLFTSTAAADISIKERYKAHEPIIATCQLEDITNDAVLYDWTVTLDKKQYRPVKNNQELHIWARPGAYRVECTAVIQRKRIVTILVKDPDDPTNITKAKMKDIEIIEKIDIRKFTKDFAVGNDPGPQPPGPTPPVPVPPGPQPPGPTPPGPTPPTPVPSDDPVQAVGYHVLIVEETADRVKLPREQVVILQSTNIRDFVKQNNGYFRQTDDDSPLIYEDPRWAQVIQRPRQGTPWIVVSNDKTWYEGPLPRTFAEAMALVQKHVPR